MIAGVRAAAARVTLVDAVVLRAAAVFRVAIIFSVSTADR